MPKAFHARFPVSVKSLKRPAARVFSLRPTKLLVVRMKKPLVPRVKGTLRASSFTRLIAGHFQQLLSEENPDFYLPSLGTATKHIFPVSSC